MIENNYPFNFKIEMEAYFETDVEEKNKFEASIIAILYPYIRAIVSTYTAQINIDPLILPAINTNKLIHRNN